MADVYGNKLIWKTKIKKKDHDQNQSKNARVKLILF